MEDTSRQWVVPAAAYGAVAVFFAFSARMELRRYPVAAVAAASIYVCLLLLFALFLAPGFRVSHRWLAARLHGARPAAICVGLFLAPYLAYASGVGDFRWTAFVKLLLFVAAPFFLYELLPVRSPDRMHWQDLLALIWLALPIF